MFAIRKLPALYRHVIGNRVGQTCKRTMVTEGLEVCERGERRKNKIFICAYGSREQTIRV